MNDYQKDVRDNLLINYYFIWRVIYEILDINIKVITHINFMCR